MPCLLWIYKTIWCDNRCLWPLAAGTATHLILKGMIMDGTLLHELAEGVEHLYVLAGLVRCRGALTHDGLLNRRDARYYILAPIG
jgi:hypothetical protein